MSFAIVFNLGQSKILSSGHQLPGIKLDLLIVRAWLYFTTLHPTTGSLVGDLNSVFHLLREKHTGEFKTHKA